MIIRDISPFKGAAMCVELDCGGDRTEKIYIHRDIVTSEALRRGQEISGDEANDLIYKNDRRRARERALYLITARDYSYGGLYDKLEENYPEEICTEVCDEMARRGLICDREYARKLCRHLFETKKLGHYRVRQEMRQKGLTEDIIVEVMDEFEETDDLFARLERLVEVKYERYLTDPKGVNKVKNALARRGYSYDEINEVIELYDLDF